MFIIITVYILCVSTFMTYRMLADSVQFVGVISLHVDGV